MKPFWEVIYDESNRTMVAIGSSSDNTCFTNNTYEMQQTGMKVHCQIADISAT